MGAGAAEFDGLRQDVFQWREIEFVLAVPAADFFCRFFGNQAVAADYFAGSFVKGQQVVAVFVVGVDVAAVVAVDFGAKLLGKHAVAQALGGGDFFGGLGQAYAQADFGAGLVETALGHDVS